ncbi:MAG: serine/threonine protein kinase, partial [Myxococcales bacterium]|nr:serine/threonine protein kinase [Myxococcales bacterium]
MQIPDEGRCPHCDCGGEVGHGCATELCQRKGYHYIPLESYQTLTANEHRNRNPSIGTVIGRYLLVSELGHGGFGTVYLALQLPIKMKAALKLVHRADSPEQAAERERRFLGEAQSLARLNHPNIVRMLQYDSIDDQPYLVMEYVPGRCSLDQEIARRRLAGTRFSTAEIERIASQVAAALDSAHGEGVIHRDLKPENLMLQEVSG